MLAEWGVPLAVAGMLAAALLVAGLMTRYQAYLALVRVAVHDLEAGLNRIAGALDTLRSVPLSRELRVALRAEVLARLHKVGSLHRRFPQLGERVVAARRALESEGPTRSNGVGPIDNERQLHQLIAAIDSLRVLLARETTLQPIPQDVRAIFRRELGDRRAETLARYHLVKARQLEAVGKVSAARTQLTTLLHQLRHQGAPTEFVRNFYIETESALSALTARQLEGLGAALDGQSQRSA